MALSSHSPLHQFIINTLRKCISIIVPGGFLLGAAVFLEQTERYPAWLLGAASFLPYIIFCVGILLGMRFNRSRLIFSILALILAERMIFFSTTGVFSPAYERHISNAASILVPFDLLLIFLFRERGVFTIRGLLRLAFILLQPLAVFLLISFRPEIIAKAAYRFHALPLPLETPIPQTALILFLFTVSVFAIKALSRKDPVASGFFWSLPAVFIAFHSDSAPAVTTLYFCTAGLILTLSVIETAYGMAFHDELTGLPGRRALNEDLMKLGSRYSVAMLDIDFFKKFNDRYGHDVGDQVLCMVASHISRVGGGGKAYRYGGEEFTVLFPGKKREEVIPSLEQLRTAIGSSRFCLRGRLRPQKKPKKKRKKQHPKKVSVTISIGVASPGERLTKTSEVIKAADKALYRAKKKGRNRVST